MKWIKFLALLILISSGIYYYQFTNKKGFETSLDGIKWKTAAAEVLRDILMGDIRIVKLPWKPKTGEKYYVPNVFNCNYYII